MRWYSELTGKTYSSEARKLYAERLHNEYISNEDKYWAKRGYIKIDGNWQKTKDIIENVAIGYDTLPDHADGIRDDANFFHSESWIGANSLYDSTMTVKQVIESAVDGSQGMFPTTDQVLEVIFGKQTADFIREYYDRRWGNNDEM